MHTMREHPHKVEDGKVIVELKNLFLNMFEESQTESEQDLNSEQQ